MKSCENCIHIEVCAYVSHWLPACEDYTEAPVRCKDCEHYINAHDNGLMYCMRPILSEDYNETGYIFPLEVPMRETDFCSYGERRADHE